jgi:Zn-dependent protease with chaperone function/tetratricopeptide (TPR) repeat protein
MTNPSHDRPLSGGENFMLLVGATATMLLFYFFALVSIALLLVVIAVEFVAFVAVLRFGLAGVVIPLLRSHVALLNTFVRSMWLGKSESFRMALKKDDNPELYLQLKSVCQKAGVPMPRRVYLEMGPNAWVQMKGLRRGAGTNILGFGYDLLAGLTRLEFEGVLAHEMMHAKLVQRGFRQLIAGAVSRAAKLTNRLAQQVANANRLKKSEKLAELFRDLAHKLTRQAARQLAACSRQDEFDADRGAAQICSAAAIRSALLKLEDISRIASRLTWRDRMAQLESGEGISEWLIQQLVENRPETVAETKAVAFNKYSTHPSLHDRIAALASFGDEPLPDSPPAMQLLARPDEAAEKLVRVIQKKAMEREQEDSKQLDRWSRKTGGSTRLQPMQGWALAVIIFGFIIGPGIASDFGAPGFVVMGVFLVAGVVMFRAGRYKDEMTLAIPDYAALKEASRKKLEATKEKVLPMEEEFNKVTLAEKKRKKRITYLAAESYKALENCDYVRAHLAAGLCLRLNNKYIPAGIAYAIACGRYLQRPEATKALQFTIRQTGMRGDSTAWGVSWALLLLGDWTHAEAFLVRTRKQKPKNATLLALLAICQNRRGKLFSAIDSARQACDLQPEGKEYAKLLIDLLLQGGLLREAHTELTKVQDAAATDTELMIDMVRLNLLSKQFAGADQWTEFAAQHPDDPHKFVRLGNAYEAARQDKKAGELFHQALAQGHYPEALIGLGRLEIHRRDKEKAREHLTAALNLNQTVGEGSANTVDLVIPIFQQLRLLRDAVLGCKAWIATMSAKMVPAALANVSLLVYAASLDEAQASLATALDAMQAGATPPLPPVPGAVAWKLAPRVMQPDGPVHPGIQSVVN